MMKAAVVQLKINKLYNIVEIIAQFYKKKIGQHFVITNHYK